MKALRRALLLAGLAGAMTLALAADSPDAPSEPQGDMRDLTALGPPEWPPAMVNGYAKLGWEHLAYFKFNESMFGVPPNKREDFVANQIPDDVKKWDGRKVVITGYMLPFKLEKGLASEFLLQRNTLGCCFGIPLAMPDWVEVKLKTPMKANLNTPITITGVLRVGPVFASGGELIAIYEMVPEKAEFSKP